MRVYLPCGRAFMVDAADAELVKGHVWFAHEPTPGKWYVRGYLRGGYPWGRVYLHRLIMGETGKLVIDHIDGDPLNNCRSNLRAVTQVLNCANRGPNSNNTSGFKGVVKYRARWRAQIMVGRKGRVLGIFLTAEDAARAYDKAARENFGECAYVNFPEAV